MSLLRSFVLMECAVSIVDTSSDHSTSIARWTQIRRTSHLPVIPSTISLHQNIASITSGTVPTGFRPSAATSTKTTTSRLVSPDSRGQPPRRVASRARRTTRELRSVQDRVVWRRVYWVVPPISATDKSTTKGLSKRHNDIDKDTFLAVLTNRRSGSGFNRGFRVRDSSMMTYIQERAALTYFYPKRKVLEDGLTTAPLAL